MLESPDTATEDSTYCYFGHVFYMKNILEEIRDIRDRLQTARQKRWS